MDDEEHGRFDTISPLLQSVKLSSKYHVRVPVGYLSLLDNTGGHAAHLREVSLIGTYLPRWDISFPPNLSTLELKYAFGPGPSSSELLSILTACPNLAVLRLRYTSFPRTILPQLPLWSWVLWRSCPLTMIRTNLSDKFWSNSDFQTNALSPLRVRSPARTRRHLS